MSQVQADYDVGIIGGGPAGSAMAAYLAKAGVSCVVFERDMFPRPHVGESLVPATNRVFKELDFLEKMNAAGFPRKFGAAWTAADKAPVYNMGWNGLEAESRADVRFGERPQEGVDDNYTFHVDRAKFDLLLLQHARELGAEVITGVGVRKVDFDNPDLPCLITRIGKTEHRTHVRMVVDASGRKTFLGNQLKLKNNDPYFDQYALHTWFDGYDRSALALNGEQLDFIFIHFLPISNTWVWQIPITDTVTSIGVVTQKEHFASSKEDREAFFWNCLKSRPELYEGLRAAKQVNGIKAEGDYSYNMSQLIGNNWLMVGDAARFVDPIFSSGVSVALNSSRFASAEIIAALQSGNICREAFAGYERTLSMGVKNWYKFISVYYRLNLLFTAFVQDPRYRLDVLKLLQGDVYDEEEPPVLEVMRQTIREVEANPGHLWHKYLGTLRTQAI